MPTHEEKIFYNRSTNSAAFCALQCIPLSFSATHIIIPFLTSRISANTIKDWYLSQSGNPYNPVESLFIIMDKIIGNLGKVPHLNGAKIVFNDLLYIRYEKQGQKLSIRT